MEIWKTIKGFENYEVSNLGNVKSLNYNKTKKEVILKTTKSMGYYKVNLYNNGLTKSFRVHQLMAVSFLNYIPKKGYVVDHIDNNKENNNLNNLQIISHRENISKDKKNKSSKYTWVSWSKRACKWKSSIEFKGKKIHLGYYNNELDAYKAYIKKHNNL